MRCSDPPTARGGRVPIYKSVRKCKRQFQSRVYLGKLCAISLGLYPSEREAYLAYKAVAKRVSAPSSRPLNPLDVWAATKLAIGAGLVKRTVLPRWVRRVGKSYGAFARPNKDAIALYPFDTPEEACAAMMAALRWGEPS